MLLVCCFCEKVRDQSPQSLWRDLRAYMVSRKLKREDTVLSYTCCHNCLHGDPGATAFRTRQSQSRASVP